MMQNHFCFNRTFFLLLTAGVLTVFGCGQITDKDRIRVAKIGEQYITRGDLFKLIREMPDAERPMIRSRGDLLRVLNDHIDTRVKLPLGKKLAAEGKVSVDRNNRGQSPIISLCMYHESVVPARRAEARCITCRPIERTVTSPRFRSGLLSIQGKGARYAVVMNTAWGVIGFGHCLC